MAEGQKQGQSVLTEEKERGLGSALSIGMIVANAWQKKRPKKHNYWHLDANAGSGFNKDFGVDGSPVVFNRLADRYLSDLTRQAFFCDHDEDALKALDRRLALWLNCYLLPGDNEEALAVFGQAIRTKENPEFALGSLMASGSPTNGLSAFMRRALPILNGIT